MWGAQGWNQWTVQPAMFNDVPHEQIDWAALAKQWIQMQQNQPPDTSASTHPPVASPSVTAPSILHPPPPGHGPMVPDDYTADVSVNTSLMKPPMGPAGIPEPFSSDRPFESDPGVFMQKPINNSYWNKPPWEANTASDVDERIWPSAPPPPPPPIEPPAAALISGKETYDYGHMHDNPPLTMQSIDYNHMSEYSYNQSYPSETPYDQYWSQVNAAPPPIAPMFLKKEHSTTTSNSVSATLPAEEDTSQIDAAKRKHLPAWIREGLEKMEQERIKKAEKEKAQKEKAEKLAKAKLHSDTDFKDDVSNPVLIKSKFDSDSDIDADEEEDSVSISKNVEICKRSPSPIEDFRTEEEKRQEYMLQLRRVLTEILLSVTNAEMYSIAEETLKKEKLKARQLASTATLTSVASGLCSLANYGTESEASEAEEEKDASDSDEELYRRIREKKKTFAIKQKKILAELERKELEEQNEALKLRNESKSANSELEDVEENKECENITIKEEIEEPVALTPPATVIEPPSAGAINTFIEIKVEKAEEISPDTNLGKESKTSNNTDSHSSDSSSSSSESESESEDKHKKKTIKVEQERISDKTKNYKREKSPSKRHRHRSSDSDSSDRHHKSRKSYDKRSRKSSSYKKKKKYKRSDSSSSSSSSTRKKKHSSSSKRNRSRERRSDSHKDRKHRYSVSPKSYRSSRDSHRSRDSYSHKHEKDKYIKREKEEKYYEYKRSPSPVRRSKLPKKYRSSRSPSSESESSRKYKRTRIR